MFPRVTHPCAGCTLLRPLDLHVLSLPPAFVLSQDQTLMLISLQTINDPALPNTNVYLYTAFFSTVKVINRNPLKTAFPLSQAISLYILVHKWMSLNIHPSRTSGHWPSLYNNQTPSVHLFLPQFTPLTTKHPLFRCMGRNYIQAYFTCQHLFYFFYFIFKSQENIHLRCPSLLNLTDSLPLVNKI